MKHFEIKINVTGCCNCPYNSDETWCTESQHLSNDELEQQYRDNHEQVTPPCPFYEQAKEE